MLSKVKMLVLGITAAFLVGCSSMGSYYQSVDSANARYVEVTIAQSKAEEARYNALARIAESGDPVAKVAATMALALGGKQETPKINTPAVPQNEALQWASILVPGVTQGMSIYYNAQVTRNASNNATALGMNTNSTFATFASEINNPVVVTQPSPTIVTQPSPVVLEQPEPIIVNPVVVEQQVVTVPVQQQ